MDGLRGFAAFLVIAQHGDYFLPLPVGEVAVDIFFVLSSFLLTSILYSKLEKQSRKERIVEILRYLLRRILRIYPLFAVVAFALSFLPRNIRIKTYFTDEPYDYNKVLSFEHRPHVFWTLPLEIAYYLVIPLFVILVLTFDKYWWMFVFPLLGWTIQNSLVTLRKAHQGLLPHLSTFLTGSIFSIFYIKLKQRYGHVQSRLITDIVGLFVVFLIISMATSRILFSQINREPFGGPTASGYLSFLLAFLITKEMIWPGTLSLFFDWSVFLYSAKISYSMYLTHSLSIYMFAHVQNYCDKLFLQWTGILVLSLITYYVIEVPIQIITDKITSFF